MEVVESLPQGVSARVCLKDAEPWKFRRIFNLREVEGRHEAKYFESLKESIVTRDRRRTSSAERRYLV